MVDKSKMKKTVLFLPKYSAKGPSSRYRIYSYLPYYEQADIDFQVKPLFDDWYLENVWGHYSKIKILHKIIWAYFCRIFIILTVSTNTIVYIGADLLPFFPPIMEIYLSLRGVKYIVELDDAIFHNYDQNRSSFVRMVLGKKFHTVLKKASVVICGCSYLADYAKKWNSDTYIIPTSIDARKYENAILENRKETLVVGWIGSSYTSISIKQVVTAIKKLQSSIDFEFHLIGFDKILEPILKGCNYKIIQWSEAKEVEYMSRFTIGIMPLEDTPFSRGKCAFKLVQYMAMGIPTVSTPLQSNIDIDKGCGNFFANNNEEWYDKMYILLKNRDLRDSIGKNNKKVAMEYYTFQATNQKKIDIIKSLVK